MQKNLNLLEAAATLIFKNKSIKKNNEKSLVKTVNIFKRSGFDQKGQKEFNLGTKKIANANVILFFFLDENSLFSVRSFLLGNNFVKWASANNIFLCEAKFPFCCWVGDFLSSFFVFSWNAKESISCPFP